MAKPQVFYNSACPVCRAGVESQRGSMEACGVNDVEWIDVHRNPEAVKEVGASLEQLRERLYIKDEQGNIKIGADAFADLWTRTPTPPQRRLGRLIRLPIVRSVARLAYNIFARCLYRWNRLKKHW
jgi:predicted DCC family thiol-disulfide oxidoreductase YuxK